MALPQGFQDYQSKTQRLESQEDSYQAEFSSKEIGVNVETTFF